MFFEGADDREKRVKAMLQYLILREACKFDDEFPTVDSGAGVGLEAQKKEEKKEEEKKEEKKEDDFKTESAKKILREMESKFLDFFVEDDLVKNDLLHGNSEKENIGSKRGEIEKEIKEQIANKIRTLQEATDNPPTKLKTTLKKIFQSTIIENSIMTQDFIDDSESKNLSMNSNSEYINLIDNIDKIDKIFVNKTEKFIQEITDTNIYLTEKKNGFCEIEENFTAIHANIATITAIGCGLINLTGKIINKSLGLEQDSKTGGENSAGAPNKSLHGDRIIKVLNSINTQVYV